MSNFKVDITETLKKSVEVNANSREQAEEIVFAQWRKREHAIGSEHFNAITFSATQQQKGNERSRKRGF